MHPESALSLNELKSRISFLSKQQEIFFYCAWPKKASAAGQAVKFKEIGL
jgi:hypothetical protein